MERILAFDPTPEGLLGELILRKAYKGVWAKIRKDYFATHDLRCMRCPAIAPDREKLETHEIYSYPSPDVVRLEELIFICQLCHKAIHLERTRHSALGWVKDAERKYEEVNGVSAAEREEDFHATLRKTAELRQFYKGKKPRLDYGPYAEMAAKVKRRETDDNDGEFEQYPDHECPWDVGHAD